MNDEIIEYQCYIVYNRKTHTVHRVFRDRMDAAYCASDNEGCVVLNPKILEHSYEGLSLKKKTLLYGAEKYMYEHIKIDGDKVLVSP